MNILSRDGNPKCPLAFFPSPSNNNNDTNPHCKALTFLMSPFFSLSASLVFFPNQSFQCSPSPFSSVYFFSQPLPK